MTDGADRRAELLAMKLRALASGWGPVGGDARPRGFPGGACLVDPAHGRCWVLLDDAEAPRRMGAALAVALRSEAQELHLVVDEPEAAGILARRAPMFTIDVSVWRSDERSLEPAEPAPRPIELPLASAAEAHRSVILDAGLTPVVENGVLIGELNGLEVARVEFDDDGEARLRPGVGRFDREASTMMFADLPTPEALARTVELVSRYRADEIDRHPLKQFVAERWLRSALVADPSLVGASELRPVTSSSPRRNLNEEAVATAVGTAADGSDLVVVSSVGVYLDLVPTAADDRLTHGPDARLLLALPERDVVPIITDLADLLVEPAEIVAVPDRWRVLGPPAG